MRTAKRAPRYHPTPTHLHGHDVAAAVLGEEDDRAVNAVAASRLQVLFNERIAGSGKRRGEKERCQSENTQAVEDPLPPRTESPRWGSG